MPGPTSRLGSLDDLLGPLGDQHRTSSPRMISGQFPDSVLDPANREQEEKSGAVVDREPCGRGWSRRSALRTASTLCSKFLELARLLEKDGLRLSTKQGILTPADIRDLVRRIYPEPGPQKRVACTARLARGLRTSSAADRRSSRPVPEASPLALSARAQAFVSSQGDPPPILTAA
jgi:hypothetical protein